jgi:hypothetical protein
MTWEWITRSMPAKLGRRSLSFDEVVAARRPAVYQEFGDSLFFLGGEVFVLLGADREAAPQVLAAAVRDRAVGIETGWRHAEGCECYVCRGNAEARVA